MKIGIELEVSGFSQRSPIYTFCDRWDAQLVRDGSIPDTGQEIVSPALEESHLEEYCEDLSSTLSECEAWTDASCGLHVHVEATDLSVYCIRKLLLAWALFEPLLFHAGRFLHARVNNHYCAPLTTDVVIAASRFIHSSYSLRRRPFAYHDLAIPREWRRFFFNFVYSSRGYTPRPANFRRKYIPSRYFALNLHAYRYHGTVEYRLFPAPRRWDTGAVLRYAQVAYLVTRLAAVSSERELAAAIADGCVGTQEQPQALASVAERLLERAAASVRSVFKKSEYKKVCKHFSDFMVPGRKDGRWGTFENMRVAAHDLARTLSWR
jgi:hypothetical protein